MQNPYTDVRARLRPMDSNRDYVYGTSKEWVSATVPSTGGQRTCPLLSILRMTNGLVWPYTPEISEQTTSKYSNIDISQANQDFHVFGGNQATKITVSGDFTADTYENAVYCLACLHFLRTVRLADFGKNSKVPGMPPPILLFSAYGRYMYDDVPVKLTNFSYTMPKDVDYITVPTSQTSQGQDYGTVFSNQSTTMSFPMDINKVPMMFSITVELIVQKTPRQLREDFSLQDLKSGKLLKKRGGGWR